MASKKIEPTYENTKRAMMEAYPSLYLDEEDVLNQLFFVNGNGYEWEDGALVSGDLDTYVEDARADQRRFYASQIEEEKKRPKLWGASRYWHDLLDNLDEPDHAVKEREREARCKFYSLC